MLIKNNKNLNKFKNKFKKKTNLLALDVDGTICLDTRYNYNFNLFFEKKDFLRSLRKLIFFSNYNVVFITNQSGIGRKYFSINQYTEYIQKVMTFLDLNYSIYVEKVFVCPHRPEDNCNCRKPNGNLLKKAISEYKVKPESVLMFGDNLHDKIELNKATNNKGNFINVNNLNNIDRNYY